jgi:hypothetical protein
MSSKVTIVIPIWKSDLSHNEKISLQQALTILKRYKFSVATYKGLDISYVMSFFYRLGVKCDVVYFPSAYFKSINDYSRLMLSYRFYNAFRNYLYILIYQLDCFVFSNCLDEWIEKDFSYIGAPWLQGYQAATSQSEVIGVGNGGLSLRKVRDHLKVLRTFKYINSVKPYFDHIFFSKKGTMAGRFLLFLKQGTITNNFFFLFNNWEANEDIFWSRIAPRCPWYLVADQNSAALFSLEVQPKRFYEKTKVLPFGCHAWWTFDLHFWKPHIEKYGYRVME